MKSRVLFLAVMLTLPLSAQFPQSLNSEEKDLFQALFNTYRLIQANSIYTNHTQSQDLILSAISGMVDSLEDPYSVLLQGQALNQFIKNIDNHYSGIGIYIVPDKKGILIVDVIQDSPAWTIGIRAQDIIVKVKGVKIENKKVDEIKNLILGPENSLVEITVIREGKELTFNVVRKNIQVPTVQIKTLPSHPKIAYMRIQTFAQNTANEFNEALTWIKSQRSTGLIVDVRNNPGGLLPVVIQMVDTLITQGTVVSTHALNSPQNSVNANYQIQLPTFIPMVVLVNRYSASASEIFAGALRDHNRAVIVGENSFGKFSVQKIFPIWKDTQKNAALKLTIARYFLPNGNSYDKIGIPPHLAVTNQDPQKSTVSLNQVGTNNDPVLEAATSILTDPERYREILNH